MRDDVPATATSRLIEPLRLLAVALQFLTRLPVPAIPVADGDVRRASAAFPLVGVVVAAVAIAVRAAAEPLVGSVAATVAAVLAAVAVTGAFHEDGLADACDGLWGGWSPEQRLEIMRDSRLGTYGTVALAGSLGLRVALLAPLGLAAFAATVAVGHVLGRASTLLLVRWLPAVPGSSGAMVAGPTGWVGSLVAAATVLAVLGVAVGPLAVVPLAAGLGAVAACRRLVRRRLGGLTGDVLGAVNQVVLLATQAAMVALWRAGWL